LSRLFSNSNISEIQACGAYLKGSHRSRGLATAYHTGASAENSCAKENCRKDDRTSRMARTCGSLPYSHPLGLSSSPESHGRTLRHLHHIARVGVLDPHDYWREEQFRDSQLHCPRGKIRPALQVATSRSVWETEITNISDH